MSPAPETLLVVAHPDDEALWFTSVLTRHAPVQLVVVTHDRDERVARRRRAELEGSAALYGIAAVTTLDHIDEWDRRLDLEQLHADLERFASGQRYRSVFTHGPLGETLWHPHHQDVSLAVHNLFDEVWSTSWNQAPDSVVALSPEELTRKREAIGSIYWREYLRLRRNYEISAVESFARLDRATVQELYARASEASWSPAEAGRGRRLARRALQAGAFETERDERVHELLREAEAPTPVRLCDLELDADFTSEERAHASTAGFELLAPAELRNERGTLVLTGVSGRTNLGAVFRELRATTVLTDVDPTHGAALGAAARAVGYASGTHVVVAPRFARLVGDSAVIYEPGAELTLWRRRRRRPSGLIAARRARAGAAKILRRLR
ncbi:MAG: PIG-L family deacetylase [Solirubrobacteraceae bacterium]|jgi:LmbE family N-acetylglucosaminyl deacetylase